MKVNMNKQVCIAILEKKLMEEKEADGDKNLILALQYAIDTLENEKPA